MPGSVPSRPPENVGAPRGEETAAADALLAKGRQLLAQLDHHRAWLVLGKLLAEIGEDALSRDARDQAEEALTALEEVFVRLSPLPRADLTEGMDRLRRGLQSG